MHRMETGNNCYLIHEHSVTFQLMTSWRVTTYPSNKTCIKQVLFTFAFVSDLLPSCPYFFSLCCVGFLIYSLSFLFSVYLYLSDSLSLSLSSLTLSHSLSKHLFTKNILKQIKFLKTQNCPNFFNNSQENDLKKTLTKLENKTKNNCILW